MSIVGLRTLVLNNQFQPLSIFPLYCIEAEDAIVRQLNETCYTIASYEREVLTPSRTDLLWPSVIVNHHAHTYSGEVKLKKESLYYRDHCRCVYCGRELSLSSITVDHLVPRSAGGKHIWENVVASCVACNEKKADAKPVGQWKPKSMPWRPNFQQMLALRAKYPITVDDEQWIQFLPRWTGEITVKRRGMTPYIYREELT